MTDPGYPPPEDICPYLRITNQYELPTNSQNRFFFDPATIGAKKGDVIMLNYPHNPSGQVFNKTWLRRLCAYCRKHGIRLFNDAAYVFLDHTGARVTLAEIAVEFPGLSWAEGFSASKIGNFTGWRIAAFVGSPKFIADICRVKADFDSGFNAALALGVLRQLQERPEEVETMRKVYKRRLDGVISILESRGMKLAFRPKAGAFSLWKTPRYAFGQRVTSAKAFNYELINRTGIVGVDFDPYYRLASFGNVEPKFCYLERAFEMAEVSY